MPNSNVNNKRRKIENEGRVFNPEWTTKYLFAVSNAKILCLICRRVVAVPKEYNLRRHFEANHQSLAELDENEKKIKAESLMKILHSEQACFKLPSNESVTATRISFEIYREIAAAGKCFTEGEFVKKIYGKSGRFDFSKRNQKV